MHWGETRMCVTTYYTAEALGKIGDKGAVKPLVKAPEGDEDEDARSSRSAH